MTLISTLRRIFTKDALWPEPKIVRSGYRTTTDGHSVYWEERGRSNGKAVLVLHGGPARGIEHSVWSFFNPRVYRIILVDQRGCGKSSPRGGLENNTTASVIQDLESIRVFLDIDKWMLFCCGCGSAFGLAYAQEHPNRVSEIILNNPMLFRASEISWLFGPGAGASQHFPEAWEKFIEPLLDRKSGKIASWLRRLFALVGRKPKVAPAQLAARNAHELLQAYYRLLTEGTAAEQHLATVGWTLWEKAISGESNFTASGANYDQALVVARIACHYFLNGGFFKKPDQLLENMGVIREQKIPVVVVWGKVDMVNPMVNARDLSRALPDAQLVLVPFAGHSTRDPGIQRALLAATAKIGGCGCWIKPHRKPPAEQK